MRDQRCGGVKRRDIEQLDTNRLHDVLRTATNLYDKYKENRNTEDLKAISEFLESKSSNPLFLMSSLNNIIEAIQFKLGTHPEQERAIMTRYDYKPDTDIKIDIPEREEKYPIPNRPAVQPFLDDTEHEFPEEPLVQEGTELGNLPTYPPSPINLDALNERLNKNQAVREEFNKIFNDQTIAAPDILLSEDVKRIYDNIMRLRSRTRINDELGQLAANAIVRKNIPVVEKEMMLDRIKRVIPKNLVSQVRYQLEQARPLIEYKKQKYDDASMRELRDKLAPDSDEPRLSLNELMRGKMTESVNELFNRIRTTPSPYLEPELIPIQNFISQNRIRTFTGLPTNMQSGIINAIKGNNLQNIQSLPTETQESIPVSFTTKGPSDVGISNIVAEVAKDRVTAIKKGKVDDLGMPKITKRVYKKSVKTKAIKI